MSGTETRQDTDYKEAVRREWTTAAPGWERWFDTAEAPTAGRVITASLLDEACLEEGDAVLDVGAGYGEPGLSAAAAVGPAGSVTCLDISGDMLAFAERRAREAGLDNVEFIEADIESYLLEPNVFDAVLSRAASMYATDPLSTLRRIHASLRPGGRLAVAVWAVPEKVAFAVPVGVMIEMGVIDPPPPGPGPFALGGEGVLEDLVSTAGFADVRAGTASRCTRSPRPAPARSGSGTWPHPSPSSSPTIPTTSRSRSGRAYQAWAPFQDETGIVRLPCTAVWV